VQQIRIRYLFRAVSPANQGALGLHIEAPQNGLIFIRRPLQLAYNPKAPYRPILNKYASHKCCTISKLRRGQKLRSVFNGRVRPGQQEDASKRILLATGILVFDFGIFTGGRFRSLAQPLCLTHHRYLLPLSYRSFATNRTLIITAVWAKPQGTFSAIFKLNQVVTKPPG
jgi:hypothetical protein